jgi:hypothetical protein
MLQALHILDVKAYKYSYFKWKPVYKLSLFIFYLLLAYISYMYMPGRENAIVGDTKLIGYLLKLQQS